MLSVSSHKRLLNISFGVVPWDNKVNICSIIMVELALIKTEAFVSLQMTKIGYLHCGLQQVKDVLGMYN